MRKDIFIMLVLAILASAWTRNPKQPGTGRFSHLHGWQKLLGVLALVLAFLILMNPDFLALGLIGDSAFFDALVLGLSLQMLGIIQWIRQSLGNWLTKISRSMGIPSPGLRWLMATTAVAIGSAMTALQKTLHRFWS